MQLTVGPGNFSSNASDIVTFGTLLYAAQVVHLECNCYHASSKCDPSNSPVRTTSSTPLVAAGDSHSLETIPAHMKPILVS